MLYRRRALPRILQPTVWWLTPNSAYVELCRGMMYQCFYFPPDLLYPFAVLVWGGKEVYGTFGCLCLYWKHRELYSWLCYAK
jgi:hypothetical protein